MNALQPFNEESFWDKVKRYAKVAGHELMEKTLTLFYCMKDTDTPAWARTVIIGALAYFVIPIDAISDFIPGGFVDDLGAVSSALLTVAQHVKAEHQQQAKEKLSDWFGGSGNSDSDSDSESD